MFFSLVSKSEARFFRPETEKVPISRLLENLQNDLKEDENNPELHYRLARVYSMAYSTNIVELDVQKHDGEPVFGFYGSDTGVPRTVTPPEGNEAKAAAKLNLENAIQHYERVVDLLKKSDDAEKYQHLILPTQLGYAWCLDQAGKRDEALVAYRRALKNAWKREVVGDLDLSEWFSTAWDNLRAGDSPFKGQNRRGLGPGVCYSEEIIGYMLKLLDPEEDRREIAELQEKQKELSQMPRAITPILVPLEDDLVFKELIDPAKGVSFDLDGSGVRREWGWITPRAAWLVYDSDGSGQITSALQMFGNVTFWIFWNDGYQALGSLDDDGDGFLRGRELQHISLWQDANSNGTSESEEVKSVESLGITGIACEADLQGKDMIWNPKGIEFSSGEYRPSYDWTVPGWSPVGLRTHPPRTGAL